MATEKAYLSFVLEQLSRLDDAAFLEELIVAMYLELPEPKRRKRE